MFFKKPSPPFIYIAGAGPGDVGLLTLRTHHVLTQEADCVVHDRLIPNEILSLIPTHVEKIYAGKSCTHHTLTQEDINARLVEEALKGKIVVRLKGGDPFIFGRGGEEAEYVQAHNIPFEIIPGVNAADGCAAALGIPLTHRSLASSVCFITGHHKKNEEIQQNWNNLTDPTMTLVIYMGLVRLETITKKLIEHGLEPNTPAAAIESGTTSAERQIFDTVQNIASHINKEKFTSPTLVIIGKVVDLAKTLKKKA